uniref:ARAD1D05742p n=1 Tax=Blastobotrys adeninivorans TaxID=409370 RepID=A0A060T8V2_BLAAD
MKSIEKQTQEKRAATVAKEPERYAEVVADLLDRVSRDDVVKYVLSLTGDLTVDVPQFTSALLKDSTMESRVYGSLTKLLDKSDEQLHLLGASTLVSLLSTRSSSDKNIPSDTVATLVNHLSTRLATSPNTHLQDIAVQALGILMRNKSYRSVLWKTHAQVIPPLLKILVESKGALQLQYHALLVLWLLSFEQMSSKEFVSSYDAVPTLLEVARTAVKEKIVRVATATLTNLISQVPKLSIPSLLANGALPLVRTLSERKWADEELVEDLGTLLEKLKEAFESMSTFDEYASELESKHLRWSPPHRSDIFWSENASKFRDKDWKAVRELDAVLSNEGADPVPLAVACNDISRLIVVLPEVLRPLQKMGTKVKIMELMNHKDSEVRYEALRATQTFIAHSFK